MLYRRNIESNLDPQLFARPTSEYRGAPFWAWNCALNSDLLVRQIDYLKEMGFGGFHMHPRTGMSTPYLSDEFMGLVKTCVEKARKENMLAWLYDEARYPSGAAGGLVTRDPAFRARNLLFTPGPFEGDLGIGGRLLARYEIILNDDGCLCRYRILENEDTGDGPVWYAYLEVAKNNSWYNNQAYVNTLDKAAIDKFIEVTYETYKKAVGEDFGGVIPAIFTDEPQFIHKTALGFATDQKPVRLPWTDDLPETFFAAYGIQLLPALPELIWELPDGQISRTRYRYHDHVAQRFTEAFADNCGAWCSQNGLALTGHMMEEPTLGRQTAALGEAMRSYRGFDLPGIDMLFDNREYNTAKQAQSAARQFGREGVMSELYGVTNWDFDLRGHKLQGDWQAALGVTVRVPHLSWVSMAGEAKRDYPASIGYQSPWYKEYDKIETHFARLNTALTRGTPHVRIGVIHPVESYWLHWGPTEQTAALREKLETRFENLTEWLIFGQLDFDFISESLLPEQCAAGGAPLKVGEMAYDAIIVPGCQTLRGTTLERLKPFKDAGGQLIILGEYPQYADAGAPDGQLDFLLDIPLTSFEKQPVLQALEGVREIDIRDAGGARTGHLVTQIRRDGENRWLFIAAGKRPEHMDLIAPKTCRIHVSGQWAAQQYDTMTGEIRPLTCTYPGADTAFVHTLFTQDSLLVLLSPGKVETTAREGAEAPPLHRGEGFLETVPVFLSEPNALLLDLAEYAFDDGPFQPADEILRIDNKFRRQLNLPGRLAAIAQPWAVPPETPSHRIRLRFTFESDVPVTGAKLALETAEQTLINLNGRRVTAVADGWYVDEAIQTVPLPDIPAGMVTLEMEAPFGRHTNLEWCYLLGDFGVKVSGFKKTLTAPVRELTFGSIVHQKLPFYGGNILYRLRIESGGGDVTVQAPFYRGACIGVTLDGQRVGTILFDPYSYTFKDLAPGPHEVGLLLFGNRVNGFGPLHNCDRSWKWHGPDAWLTHNDQWSYEYNLKDIGILKTPTVVGINCV